jgi:hypothetical protein
MQYAGRLEAWKPAPPSGLSHGRAGPKIRNHSEVSFLGVGVAARYSLKRNGKLPSTIAVSDGIDNSDYAELSSGTEQS